MPVYRVYGVIVGSPWELELPRAGSNSIDVDVTCATEPEFHAKTTWIRRSEPRARGWFETSVGPDGSRYLSWTGLADFVVEPGGGTILVRPSERVHDEALQAYLFNQVLSFALVERGEEPIHATTLEHAGYAVALVGPPGTGKSTLAAALLSQGFRLLTDDLLLIRAGAAGPEAQPGFARIKLFPRIASRLLPEADMLAPMNPGTRKLVLRLPPDLRCEAPVPLARVYILRRRRSGPAKRTVVRKLSGASAFAELTGNTFNPVVESIARLQRHLPQIASVVRSVPVRSVSYSSGLHRLDDISDSLLRDLAT